MASPTARTLQYLRREGYEAGVVEQRIPRCFITRDYLGIIDVIAVKPGEPPLGVQCTSASNLASRVTKALATLGLRSWLASGARFECWGWRKSRKTRRWEVTRREVLIEDLDGAVEAAEPKTPFS